MYAILECTAKVATHMSRLLAEVLSVIVELKQQSLKYSLWFYLT
jgi:hypothetical protein